MVKHKEWSAVDITSQQGRIAVVTATSRIVNVSSAAYHVGRIRYKDIHWENRYSKWGAYSMSKLSNLLFTRELSESLTGLEFSV